jgi:hypothetical protein
MSTITLTITLADGTSRSLHVASMPKHWKSVLLRSLPYGTDVQGAAYSISKH